MMPSHASFNHRRTKNLLSGLGTIDPEVTFLQLVINNLIHAAGVRHESWGSSQPLCHAVRRKHAEPNNLQSAMTQECNAAQ
jgi:hypothetical protein